MSALLDEVRREIVDLHVFFTDWFNGKADRSKLEERFISRLHPDLIFIPPEGTILRAAHLKAGFEHSYGANPNFRIQIRDVEIQHDLGDYILATYSEWQVGAKASKQANNARLSSVVMAKGAPMIWVHLQETWLPEDVRAAGSFDF
ncbi:MAG: hypothetical protein AAGD43_23990 [Pseudomonadota bacterium]